MQTRKEELWNTISHGIGIVLSIISLFVLLLYDSGKTAYSTMSILLYSGSLIVLYSASTIYHSVHNEKQKLIWKKIDHISIYFLIAGTYTPVSLIALEKSSGWLIFSIIWSIAGLGTLLKIFFTGRYEIISLLLYLFMGWLIVFDINNLIDNVSKQGFQFMMLGGVLYTLGVVFYAIKKIPFNHVIWHFFVLGGSVFHFFFILTII